MPSAFIPSPRGIAELARDAGMASGLGEIAEQAAARTREIAPVGDYAGGGDYRDSIDSDFGVDAEGAFGRVNAFDYKANWIEFGTEDTPVFAPLRRAVEELGYEVSGGPE